MDSIMKTPTELDDFVVRNDNVERKIRDVANGGIPFPDAGKVGLLLYGSYGTGKTELAKRMPVLMERSRGGTENADDVDIRKVVCAPGSNGVDLLSSIRTNVSLVPFNASGLHYVVLDEADILTTQAMSALKGQMSEWQNVVWLLTTNSLSDIDKGVRDRCIELDFGPAPPERWLPKCRAALASAGIEDVSDDKLLRILKSCDGSAREVVNAMNRLASRKRAA